MAMQCARSAAIIIGGSSQSQSHRAAPLPLFFSSDAAASTTGNDNGKDNTNHHTTKDSLAMMLRDELKLSAKDSKRAIDAVFDKIVEVSTSFLCVFWCMTVACCCVCTSNSAPHRVC